MSVRRFLVAVYHVVENMMRMELSDQGKAVIVNYIQNADGETVIEKTRTAIYRYTSLQVPTLEEIRKKHRIGRLTGLDDLVLRMEYEAKRVPPDAGL